MRSEDTAPETLPASSVDHQVAADLDHLLACWPTNHLNGETHLVAFWCAWSPDSAIARLCRLRDAGEIAAWETGKLSPRDGLPLIFWTIPEGACGMEVVVDPQLNAIGIYRGFNDDRVIRYQGEPELEVRRRARRLGYSLAGYRLIWKGSSPTMPIEQAQVARG
jgi:hypothetical protein